MNGLMSCDEKTRKIPQHDNKVTCKKLTKPFQCPFSPSLPNSYELCPIRHRLQTIRFIVIVATDKRVLDHGSSTHRTLFRHCHKEQPL